MSNRLASPTSVQDLIITVLAIAVIAIFVMAIVSLFGAVRGFIRSEGDEAAKTKGRNAVRFTSIGVILTVIILTVMPLAFSFLGIQNSQMFAAKNIFARAGEIIDRVFLFGNDVSIYYQENGLQISPDRSVDVNAITNSNGDQPSDGIEYKL